MHGSYPCRHCNTKCPSDAASEMLPATAHRTTGYMHSKQLQHKACSPPCLQLVHAILLQCTYLTQRCLSFISWPRASLSVTSTCFTVMSLPFKSRLDSFSLTACDPLCILVPKDKEGEIGEGDEAREREREREREMMAATIPCTQHGMVWHRDCQKAMAASTNLQLWTKLPHLCATSLASTKHC